MSKGQLIIRSLPEPTEGQPIGGSSSQSWWGIAVLVCGGLAAIAWMLLAAWLVHVC